MKTFAAALTLIAFGGAAIACPDEAKDAQAPTGLLSSQLAKAQPQMSPAPAPASAKTTAVSTLEAPKAATTPKTAATDAKKTSPGG